MRRPYRHHVFCCTGATCGAQRGQRLKALFKGMLPDRKELGVRVSTSSCQGMCERGPNVCVYPQGVVYHRVGEEDVERIVAEHLRGGRPVEEILRRTLDPDQEPSDS